MITARERREVATALARAHRKGIAIMGHGTRKDDGAPVWAVSSASEANRLHLVAREGSRLRCDCAWSQRGRVCAHRALVHEELCRVQSRPA